MVFPLSHRSSAGIDFVRCACAPGLPLMWKEILLAVAERIRKQKRTGVHLPFKE